MIILQTKNNIFDLPKNEFDAVTITTNGIVKNNGSAVMGAGIAKEANLRYSLADELGTHIINNGNIPHLFTKRGLNNAFLISYPTKFDYRDNSDNELIKQSAYELRNIVKNNNIKRCFITPPGVGLGRLNLNLVINILKDILIEDSYILVLRR